MKKEETKNVNKDFDKSFVVINNLIDKEFNECKSYNDSIENLKTIEKIFKKLNYIPNPDITMKLIDENLLLSETIKIIVNNDFDKSFGVINNLVNKEFKNCKSYNDSIKNLETIEKIFKKLNYIPNPDIIMKLVEGNY